MSEDDTTTDSTDGMTSVQIAAQRLIDGLLGDDDSHTEEDNDRIHPSQIGGCRRQAYLSKLGLQGENEYEGALASGEIIHQFFEDRSSIIADELGVSVSDVETEVPIEYQHGDVTFVGHADYYVEPLDLVLDLKTRNGWYNFEAEDDRYLDQLHCYAMALDAENLGIIYLSKKDSPVAKTWPTSDFGDFDWGRWGEVIARAHDVVEAAQEVPRPTDEDEIPFDKCGCYFCNSETLDLPEPEVATDDDIDVDVEEVLDENPTADELADD